jgi:adenine phosphoribosyltransferase
MNSVSAMKDLKSLIREVPDFPKPGINFYDITTLLKDPDGLHSVIDSLCRHYADKDIRTVAGIEARGFIFAPALAYALNAGFVPIRKPKKLPAATERVEYALEYGTDAVEMHVDAIVPGQNVLIVDDVLATGGTAAAAARLVEKLGGKVAGLGFLLELDFLSGRKKLAGYDVDSLLHYAS